LATGTLDIRFGSTSLSLGDLLPTLPKGHKVKKPQSAEDVHSTRMRWAFLGLVAGAFAAYLAVVKDLEIKWVEVEEPGNSDEEEGASDVRSK
jgi:hypothetical protein